MMNSLGWIRGWGVWEDHDFLGPCAHFMYTVDSWRSSGWLLDTTFWVSV